MGKQILSMSNIIKRYDMAGEELTVLKGIDLNVGEGEFLAVLGPSGSGKSTLMNIIGCLDTPTEGEYYLSGHKIEDQDEETLSTIRNKEIGFIFQSFHLMQKQSAARNVEMPMIYAGIGAKERRRRAVEMLEQVGLGDKVNHLPNQLSGGQQQRVAIARAISNDPAILLADEPTGALDQKTGKQVMQLFHDLNDRGRTIIMITHDANIAKQAKRIVKIVDGNMSEGVITDA